MTRLEGNSFLLRTLSIQEEIKFREYARSSDPHTSKWEIFHPICIDEWRKLGWVFEKGQPPRRQVK